MRACTCTRKHTQTQKLIIVKIKSCKTHSFGVWVNAVTKIMLIFKEWVSVHVHKKLKKNKPHTFFDEMDDEMIPGSEDLF